MAVPISTREPKQTVNQSAATPLKRTIAVESTNQKPRSTIRKQYEQTSETCKWWYSKMTPPKYKWKPKTSTMNVTPNVSMPLGNKSRTTNNLESNTIRGSTLSNTPLTSNSFAARRDNSIHRRLWVLKAHDGKSQAPKDGENLDKMKEKGDACIFVWYSTQSRAYRVYNKRTRVIIKTIHVNFDELPQMASDHVSSDPVPQCSTTVLKQVSLSPGPQSQENVPQPAETVTTSNELDFLFSLMFDELLNGTTQIVLKSSAVHATDAPNQRQQQNTTPSTSTTVAADIPPLNIQTTPETTSQAPTVTGNENIIQAETNKKYAQVDKDEFINIFSTPVQEQGETSS
ncbi:hypothetical protein Tco_1328121 [Tanacetum coccineum]